tara:strand:+ start:235 stop:600 length:366 start_codon:yes stop_codon:yes gene_type:complete
MNLNYQTDKSVKPILRFIKMEQLLRSNWLAGESNSSLFGISTWSESKRKKVEENYIKRIPQEKVKVFYLDLIEHVIKEKGEEVERDGTWTTNSRITQVNQYYRIIAYYNALVRLGVKYYSN